MPNKKVATGGFSSFVTPLPSLRKEIGRSCLIVFSLRQTPYNGLFKQSVLQEDRQARKLCVASARRYALKAMAV